jgi:hypothetical protein
VDVIAVIQLLLPLFAVETQVAGMVDAEPPLREFARRVGEYPIVCVAVYYCSVRGSLK